MPNSPNIFLHLEQTATAVTAGGESRTAAATFVMDETGQVQSFDAEAERLFHCRASDAVGQPVFTLLPGLSRSLFKQAESAPTSQIVRLDACPKDGSRVSVELTLTKVRLGTQRLWIGTLCDLNRHHQAAESLRRSAETYHQIFDQALIGIFHTSPEGHHLRANQELARIYGYDSAEALIAQHRNAVRNLYAVPHRREEFKRLLQVGENVTNFESQIRRRDGSLLWISENARAVRDQGGALLYYEGTVQDISARKAAETALREREQQLQTIFDTVAVGIVRVDMNGILTRSNPAFQKMLGYTAEELEGIAFARLTHSDDSPANVQCQWDLQEGLRDSYHVEKRYCRADGSLVWADLTMTLIRDGEVKPQFAIAVVEDISESRRAQQQILALNESLGQRVQRITALHQIGMAITASPSMEFALGLLLEQTRAQLGVDAAAVLLCDSAADTLNYAAVSGLHHGVAGRVPLPLAFGYAGQAAREQRIVEVTNLVRTPEVFAHDPQMVAEGFVAYWAIPLVAKGDVQGVLEVFHRTPLDADGEWRECLDVLAGLAAIAIDSAALFQDLQSSHQAVMEAYEATIEGWACALDLRDQETEGHSRRVTDLTARLAQALGMEEAQIVHVRRGSLLHDIGKMGVPDRILLKTDNLTPTEWRVMRKHPQDAYEMLAPISFLRPALDIPYSHHEKWDGTGYPQGLAGEDIPLAARLFAIVDVWDALRSDRPYRPAWPEFRVLDHLRELSGIHFDPHIVEAFLEMMTGKRDSSRATAGESDLLPLGNLAPLAELLPLRRAA